MRVGFDRNGKKIRLDDPQRDMQVPPASAGTGSSTSEDEHEAKRREEDGDDDELDADDLEEPSAWAKATTASIFARGDREIAAIKKALDARAAMTPRRDRRTDGQRRIDAAQAKFNDRLRNQWKPGWKQEGAA